MYLLIYLGALTVWAARFGSTPFTTVAAVGDGADEGASSMGPRAPFATVGGDVL